MTTTHTIVEYARNKWRKATTLERELNDSYSTLIVDTTKDGTFVFNKSDTRDGFYVTTVNRSKNDVTDRRLVNVNTGETFRIMKVSTVQVNCTFDCQVCESIHDVNMKILRDNNI